MPDPVTKVPKPDWPRTTTRTWKTERRWLGEPDLAAWLVGSRLNLLGALPAHAGDSSVRSALERYLANVGPAVERLAQLDEPRAPAGAPGKA